MRGRAALLGGGSGLALALVLALAGCGGGDSEAQPKPTGSASAVADVPSGYPDDTEPGPDYTEPGSELALGAPATLAWQPSAAAGVGTLQMSVSSIQRTTFAASFRDWKVADGVAGYTPYFVRVSITNAGTTPLGGLSVPLYGETSADVLLEPSRFASTFKPCSPSAFPRPFGPGKATQACLVFLVPGGGELSGVTFRPTPTFEPIVWRGTVQTIAPDPAPSATMSK